MKILKPLIEQLVKVVKEGYDLGKRELPVVAQELLKYSFWIAVVQTAVLMLTIIALSALALYMGRMAVTENGFRETHGEYWLGVFILLACSLGIGAAVLDLVDKILKIKLAPRVFVLETLRDYLN